jgi:hypothetical protein
MKLLPLYCLALACCAAPKTESPAAPEVPIPALQRIPTIVEIISSPPGARIEVNGEYVGDAPCRAEVIADGHGKLVQDVTINALPIFAGQQVQSKRFHGAHMSAYSQKAPSRVFFDMNLVTVPNRIEVEMR